MALLLLLSSLPPWERSEARAVVAAAEATAGATKTSLPRSVAAALVVEAEANGRKPVVVVDVVLYYSCCRCLCFPSCFLLQLFVLTLKNNISIVWACGLLSAFIFVLFCII